jgi:hypothetical protein
MLNLVNSFLSINKKNVIKQNKKLRIKDDNGNSHIYVYIYIINNSLLFIYFAIYIINL